MKTIYYSIRSVYAPNLLYYLTKTVCENDVLSNSTKKITEASAMRLMRYSFLNFKMSEWRGNIFTFIEEAEELTSEENERITEILEDLPVHNGLYSEAEMELVFAYFGVDPDESETEG